MPFVPAPNIVECEVRASLDSQNIENRFMVNALAPVTDTVLEAIWNKVEGWVATTYFPNLPTAVHLREIVVTDLSVVDGAQIARAPDPAISGSINATPMPNESTLCVSLRTGHRGRSARGRQYVLALQQPGVVGNLVNAGYAELLRACFGTLITEIEELGMQLTIVSYRANNAPRPGGPIYFPVTSATLTDLIVDSMRRRKPGVGS